MTSPLPIEQSPLRDKDPVWIASPDQPVLVTGASGFIGARVVKTLLDLGFREVRCFVRSSHQLQRLDEAIGRDAERERRVVLMRGNLLVREECAQAVSDAAVLFHLAAGIEETFAGCFMNSVLTTRNLLEAVCTEKTLRRFVNISSFAVYSNLRLRRGAQLDEDAPLEDQPSLRDDPYGYAKLKQEQLVERYHREGGIPYVTLRPGAVYGPGKPSLSGRVGVDTFGVFLHLGGGNQLPLTYVDNCAEAIVLAGLVPGIDGETFNVVDDDLPTSRSFLRRYKRSVGGFRSIRVPYRMAYVLCALWEEYSLRSGGQLPPRFNRRRCSAEWKGNRYTNRKLKQMVGWSPRVPFDAASESFFGSVRSTG
jgi:nucleoside-diphosphate-sugar epimerase